MQILFKNVPLNAYFRFIYADYSHILYKKMSEKSAFDMDHDGFVYPSPDALVRITYE